MPPFTHSPVDGYILELDDGDGGQFRVRPCALWGVLTWGPEGPGCWTSPQGCPYCDAAQRGQGLLCLSSGAWGFSPRAQSGQACRQRAATEKIRDDSLRRLARVVLRKGVTCMYLPPGSAPRPVITIFNIPTDASHRYPSPRVLPHFAFSGSLTAYLASALYVEDP